MKRHTLNQRKKSKVKVFMLGWELPPHHTGGLGMVCYQMCKQLAQMGADIEFILPYTADYSSIDFMKVTPAHDQSVEEVLMAGGIYDSQKFIEVKKNGSVNELDLRQQQDLFVSNVAKLTKLAEFDVIHAHDWLTMRAAIAAKHISGKPLITHIHATEYDRSGGAYGNPTVRDIEYYGMMMSDKVIAVSQYVKDVLTREYQIPADKIQVVHNSIDKDLFKIDHSSENTFKVLSDFKRHGYKIVSNVGRLTLQKNLVNTMKAMEKVIKKQPKTLFLIVGSGEQRLELIEQAADLGISQNVFFVPFQTGKIWKDSFRISDLFLMPSTSEPFGITPLEAIGFGAPVLISKQSGVSEVLQNALKVDFWDVDEMANEILAVVESDSLQQELYENSVQEFEKMGWHGAADKMLELYRSHALEATTS